MAKYRVTEVVHYEIEADSAEDAEEWCCECGDRDQACCEVSDRYATRITDTVEEIPADHPVQPLGPDDPAECRATCGHCGLSWDDGKVTSLTPTPAARCPFEWFHKH